MVTLIGSWWVCEMAKEWFSPMSYNPQQGFEPGLQSHRLALYPLQHIHFQEEMQMQKCMLEVLWGTGPILKTTAS